MMVLMLSVILHNSFAPERLFASPKLTAKTEQPKFYFPASKSGATSTYFPPSPPLTSPLPGTRGAGPFPLSQLLFQLLYLPAGMPVFQKIIDGKAQCYLRQDTKHDKPGTPGLVHHNNIGRRSFYGNVFARLPPPVLATITVCNPRYRLYLPETRLNLFLDTRWRRFFIIDGEKFQAVFKVG